MVEQHLVEVGALDLVGVGIAGADRLVEVVGELGARLFVDELGARLVDVAPVDLFEDAELAPDVVREGQHRLADVEARELLALEDEDAALALPQKVCGRRARRTATRDDDVES